jgi:hypothetical protein
MKRSSLGRDPEQVRRWVQRSRKPLKPVGARSKRERSRALPVGPLSPLEWREATWKRSGGVCWVTGEPLELDASFFVWSAHHMLPKRLLAPEVRYDARNGIPLLSSAHSAHTSRMRVIPFETLPDSAMEFATEIGDWAIAALLREHPRTKGTT